MHSLSTRLIEQALMALGELLRSADERHAIVVTGGATLNLLGIVRRTTSDVDVIARASRDDSGALRLEEPEPFPPALRDGIRTVARDLGLDPSWMNAEVGMQWAHGLPPRTAQELEWRNYGGGLDVGLVGRGTLIALKLYAAVDQGRRSVHFQDLLRLEPSEAELEEAMAWVLTQDASERWPALVEEAVRDARRDR